MDISSEIRVMVVCLIPPGHYLYSITSQQKAKSKLSLIKNPRDMHIHNSLLNVVIHMPCVNIHGAGRYQLQMVFTCTHLPTIAMENILHESDCI